jgi:uncharacterized protein (TIGR04255 family)
LQTSTTLKKGELSYSPINNAHSIVETVFFIQFSPAFGASTIRKLISVKDELKEQFPKSNPINRTAFKFDLAEGGQTVMNEAESVGIELQRTRADGSLEWMLRIAEDIVSVHCLDYTRWDEVWQQAETYLTKALGHIDGSDSFVSSIGLRCIDRFLYKDDPKQSNLTELFKQDTPYIVKTAFTHGPLWHCHSGWFEGLNDLECLIQLNVNADFANIEGKKALSITVDHSATAILEQQASNQTTNFSPIMNQLHDKNKRLLIDLLTQKMATRINLSLPTGE